MKKNILLLLLFIVLVGLAYFLINKNNSSTIKSQYSNFSVKDTASITKIFLADKQNRTVLLERTSGGKWTVNKKYNAKQDAVNLLLQTICDVSVKAPVTKSKFEGTVKLMSASSVKVEIYQGKDKPSKVYYVGHANQDHTGTYMLLENSTVPFLMHIEGFKGYLTPRYFTLESEWRSTEVFVYDLGEIANIRLEDYKNPKNSFEIQLREDKYHLFTYPEYKEVPFDTAKLLLYSALYKKIHFEYYANPILKDSVLNTKPLFKYTVMDVLGRQNSIVTYLKPAEEGAKDYDGVPLLFDVDRMFALYNNQDFVIVQYYVFDPITKSIDYFLRP